MTHFLVSQDLSEKSGDSIARMGDVILRKLNFSVWLHQKFSHVRVSNSVVECMYFIMFHIFDRKHVAHSVISDVRYDQNKRA